MICPYCSVDMEQIELGGKTFCSNCGMTIGESPEPEKVDVSINHISENDSYGLDHNVTVPSNPSSTAPAEKIPTETEPLIVMEHSDINADEISQIGQTISASVEDVVPEPEILVATEPKETSPQKVPDITSIQPPIDDSEHVREELIKMMGETLSSEDTTKDVPETSNVVEVMPDDSAAKNSPENSTLMPLEAKAELLDSSEVPVKPVGIPLEPAGFSVVNKKIEPSVEVVSSNTERPPESSDNDLAALRPRANQTALVSATEEESQPTAPLEQTTQNLASETESYQKTNFVKKETDLPKTQINVSKPTTNDIQQTSDIAGKRFEQTDKPITVPAFVDNHPEPTLPKINNLENSFGDIKPDLMESIFEDRETPEAKTSNQPESPSTPTLDEDQASGVKLTEHSTKPKDFDKQVKKIDVLGASGVLLDILDDDAIEKADEKKIETYETAEILIDKIPFKQPKELRMFEEVNSSIKEKPEAEVKEPNKVIEKSKPNNLAKALSEKTNVGKISEETVSSMTPTVVSDSSESSIAESVGKGMTEGIKDYPKIEKEKHKSKRKNVKILTPEEIMASFKVDNNKAEKTTKSHKKSKLRKNKIKKGSSLTIETQPETSEEKNTPEEISYIRQTNRIGLETTSDYLEDEEKKDIKVKEGYNKKEVDFSKFETPNANHSALKDYFVNIFSNK